MVIGHRIVGSGKEGVIVLHGWFGDHSVFEPMFPYLDTATFAYAFVDYRGYGLSRNVAGDHTMTEIAADAVGLAQHLGWERFHVVGHSMGGMAAQRIAVDHRRRVKSGVCITPVPAAGVPLDAAGEDLFYGAAASDEKRAGILAFSTGNRLSQSWVQWMTRRSRETTTQDAYADYARAFTKTNFADAAKGLATPILVAIGEHDLALTKDVMTGTFMAWYPNAKLEVIANAGHYPMLETPVYLATLIEKFMREHAR
jgi:pimeloyl-ACP methyl ester carboxylesterase